MSASMAEGIAGVLDAHAVEYREWYVEDGWNMIYKSICRTCGELPEGPNESAHQAEQLAANGYGKLEDAKAAALREAALELMNVSEADSRMPGIRFAVGFLGGARRPE